MSKILMEENDMDTITVDSEVMAPAAQSGQQALATPSAHLPPAAAETGSAALMRMIEKGVMDPAFDVAKLEKLLAVKKDWERDEARKAFVAAKAAFRAEAPTVGKDKHVHFDTKDGPAVDYYHATLGNIVGIISPILGRHGLSHAWDTKQTDGGITEVTCILTHALGHSERVTLRAGLDTSGKKNAIQQMRSTISYLQRATLELVTGTATHDEDDDGLSSEATMMIDEDQKAELIRLQTESGADTAKFLEHLGVKSLDELPAVRFLPAKKALQEKIRVNAAKKKPDNGGFPGDTQTSDARAKIKGDHR